MHLVEVLLVLVALATLVAATADRLRAPAPSLLVLGGLCAALLPGVPDVHVNPAVVGLAVLPPLLYAGATDVSLPDLRACASSVASLSVGLVGATATSTALLVHQVHPAISVSVGLVLGSILASTDPVAVGALARSMSLPPRLLALVQGESLLNDATSLMLFQVAVTWVLRGHASPVGAAGQFLELALGGVVAGLATAFVGRRLSSVTADPVLGPVLALLLPYGAFVGADLLHGSGVTAVVVAGLGAARRDPRHGSAEGRNASATVYAVVVFVLESAIFGAIGLQLPTLLRGITREGTSIPPLVLAVTGVLVLSRVAWVAATALVASATPRQQTGQRDGGWRTAAVTSWIGTRGVVPLAAALSIPQGSAGHAFPHRDLLLVVASSVIVVTLVVQGLTLAPLARHLGVRDDPQRVAGQAARARELAARAAQARLKELLAVEAVPDAVAARLTREAADRVDRRSLAGSAEEEPPADYQRLRRELLLAEGRALWGLREAGLLDEAVRRTLQADVDAEMNGP
ncbi:MAG: Na+/H+ antiporter [Actinomycetota bacterium]|nr:Na+/H+ antiporter [Actinomycetota bacterium]